MAAVKIGKCEMSIISVRKKLSTKKHRAELLKYPNKKEEILLHGMVILLGFSWFLSPICNMLFLLDGYGIYLVVRSIGMYVERYVVIGVCNETIQRQYSFNNFEFIVHFLRLVSNNTQANLFLG